MFSQLCVGSEQILKLNTNCGIAIGYYSVCMS